MTNNSKSKIVSNNNPLKNVLYVLSLIQDQAGPHATIAVLYTHKIPNAKTTGRAMTVRVHWEYDDDTQSNLFAEYTFSPAEITHDHSGILLNNIILDLQFKRGQHSSLRTKI